MIGQTLSHYKILEKLGEGGMGVVYKAYDTRLKRPVALKFLSRQLLADEQQRRRFLHEAQATAGLTHPNICTVHEIHEADVHTFMVMEYIEGKSLKDRIDSGPLEIGEALDLAIQVGKGLSKAHAQGIVHRDIKPGNVLMTPEGDAKIVDFGLAKLAAQTRLTRTGATVGTVMYMSPEQAKGDGVDHRTDIWSLGVMLYEMLTGKLPFRGDIEHAVVYSIINEDPVPVTTTRKDVPIAVEEIVEKALAKDPSKRYQTVDELLSAVEKVRDRLTLGIKERRFTAVRRLRRRKRLTVGVSAVVVVALAALLGQIFYKKSTVIDSIAVLPLENLSGDPDQEYLVDGITGDLITGLSRVSGFSKVISRLSVMQYKGTRAPLRDIAGALGVKVVMAGTVQRIEDQVKLGVELIDAETGKNLWSESYEKDLGEIETLINEITRTVAGTIDVGLTPDEEARLSSSRTVDRGAYETYLRARASWSKLSRKDLEKSFEYFEQSIQKDSTYAPAFAALAMAYADDGILWSDQKNYSKAKATVVRALELDDRLAETHVALAKIRYVFEWDWDGADQAFHRALELNPNSGDVHREYGLYLTFMGRFDEGIQEYQRALELDPLSLYVNQSIGWGYYHARRFDEAVARFEKTLALIQEFPNPAKEAQVRQQLVWCYLCKGMYKEAFAKIDEWGLPDWVRAWAYVKSGRREEVPELIEKVLNDPSVPGYTTALLDEKDLAFERLETRYGEHGSTMLFLKVAVEFDNLRSDPRYQDLLRRMNFPE